MRLGYNRSLNSEEKYLKFFPKYYYPSTPETPFSEPQFNEIFDLMNKLQLPFTYFTLYPDSI